VKLTSGLLERVGGLKVNIIRNEARVKFEQDGFSILVDKWSKPYLDDVTVDFVDSLTGAGFKFENPNSTGSCGCGQSFSV